MVVEIFVMTEGKKGTFVVQLSLQLLVLVGQRLVHQQKLMVQLGPLGRASLKRGSVSIICEDSRRVIFTRPSFNYSTRISGTGDNGYQLRKKLTEESLPRQLCRLRRRQPSPRTSSGREDSDLLGVARSLMVYIDKC